MDAFPLSGWLIMTVPPVLMILSVVHPRPLLIDDAGDWHLVREEEQ